MIKIIKSVTNPLIKDLLKLRRKGGNKDSKQILVEGEDFIDLAYENNKLKLLIATEENPKYDVDQVIVPNFIFEKLALNCSSLGILGVCSFEYHQNLKGDCLLYLDNVQDPGNVGTLIRTALAFGYDGVVIGSDSASIYNQKVINSSKGAIFKLKIYVEDNLEELKKAGYHLLATALEGAEDYLKVTKPHKFALILGNEGSGIKLKTRELADDIIKISINRIDSLNVAVAGGILMNYFRK